MGKYQQTAIPKSRKLFVARAGTIPLSCRCFFFYGRNAWLGQPLARVLAVLRSTRHALRKLALPISASMRGLRAYHVRTRVWVGLRLGDALQMRSHALRPSFCRLGVLGLPWRLRSGLELLGCRIELLRRLRLQLWGARMRLSLRCKPRHRYLLLGRLLSNRLGHCHLRLGPSNLLGCLLLSLRLPWRTHGNAELARCLPVKLRSRTVLGLFGHWLRLLRRGCGLRAIRLLGRLHRLRAFRGVRSSGHMRPLRLLSIRLMHRHLIMRCFRPRLRRRLSLNRRMSMRPLLVLSPKPSLLKRLPFSVLPSLRTGIARTILWRLHAVKVPSLSEQLVVARIVGFTGNVCYQARLHQLLCGAAFSIEQAAFYVAGRNLKLTTGIHEAAGNLNVRLHFLNALRVSDYHLKALALQLLHHMLPVDGQSAIGHFQQKLTEPIAKVGRCFHAQALQLVVANLEAHG